MFCCGGASLLCMLQVPILCLRHGDSIHSAYESTVVNELLEVRGSVCGRHACARCGPA